MRTSTKTHSPALLLFLVAVIVLLFWMLVTQSMKAPQQQKHQQVNSQQQEKFHWKLVTTWPKNFPGLGQAPLNFAKSVEKMSDGRLTVTVYGAGELVPAMGVFDAVSSGGAEAGHGAAYYWKGKNTALQFFTSVPFGMNAQEMNGWLYYGGGMELWREILEPFNLIPFAGGNTGVQMGGWFNKEIRTLQDIKGLKMRIPGLAGEVWNRAGGSSVNIPGGELYTSLQTGVIDATEWVGPYNDLAFGFYQVAQYYYYPGWHEPGATLELLVNKDAYERLPEDLQAIVETAARSANQEMLDEYTGRNNGALQELVNEHGVEMRRYPEDVWVALKHIADDIYRAESARNPDFKRVYEAYRDFQQSVRAYHNISEYPYYQLRDLESDEPAESTQ